MKIKPEDLKNYIGKKIRLNGWSDYIVLNGIGKRYLLGTHYLSPEIEDVYGLLNDWETYEEPKKKVKMWKWIVRQASDNMIAMTAYFYSSEENARKHFNELKLFFNPIQRADWTEIEVDE